MQNSELRRNPPRRPRARGEESGCRFFAKSGAFSRNLEPDPIQSNRNGFWDPRFLGSLQNRKPLSAGSRALDLGIDNRSSGRTTPQPTLKGSIFGY